VSKRWRLIEQGDAVGALTGLTLWAVTLLGDPVPLGCTGVKARARLWRRGAIGTAFMPANRWSSCDQGEVETSARQRPVLPSLRARVAALRRAAPLWFAAGPGFTQLVRKHRRSPGGGSVASSSRRGAKPPEVSGREQPAPGCRRVSGQTPVSQVQGGLPGLRAPGSFLRRPSHDLEFEAWLSAAVAPRLSEAFQKLLHGHKVARRKSMLRIRSDHQRGEVNGLPYEITVHRRFVIVNPNER